MQLSTKARYAARAMVELALNNGKGPLQLKEIAKRQGISGKYLEQVMFPLRINGYIYTLKGNRGGYMLSTTKEEITLYDIIQSVEGSLAPVACVDNPDMCDKKEQCVTHDVWSRLNDLITAELKSVTLAEMAAKQKEKQNNNGSEI